MNEAKKEINLTEGPIVKNLARISLPIMATSVMQMMYNLTDMFWLGMLSSGAVAASGTVGMFLWLSMAFLFIGRIGAEIGVSQNIGRGDVDTAQKYAQNAFSLATFLGIAYGSILILARAPLVGFFDIQDQQVIDYTKDYLIFSAIAIPFMFLNGVIAGTFNATGNAKLPFYINFIGLSLNIIISPILIFTFDLGVLGAAVGTVIAQSFTFCLLCLAMSKYKTRPFKKFNFFAKPEKVYIHQILKWSLPVAIESASFTFLSMIAARFISSHGVSAMAVQRVGVQVESLSWLISGGFATAFTTFVGQNYGIKKYSRIREGYKIGVGIMFIWGVITTVIFIVFPEYLVSIFLHDSYEIALGVVFLRIFAAMQITSCIEGVAAGFFRGRGLTSYPSIVSISGNIFRTILAFILMNTDLGIYGIWLGIVIGSNIRAIWLIVGCMISSRYMPQTDGV